MSSGGLASVVSLPTSNLPHKYVQAELECSRLPDTYAATRFLWVPTPICTPSHTHIKTRGDSEQLLVPQNHS